MTIQPKSFPIPFVLLALACGGANARPACEPSEEAQMRIETTDRLNPNEEGVPLPTIVRVYQLANIGTMETATFEDIWQRDEDTLGDEFLGKDELTVYPRSIVNRPFERNPDANYIVGVGIFRRPTGVSWRTILELPPPASEAACADLQENPDAPPEEQPIVYLSFELDDYMIEGSVRLEYPPPPCADDDPICQAEQAAEQAVGDNAPEQPSDPSGDAAGEAASQGQSNIPQQQMPNTQPPAP